jgi:hypothetical protein
MNTTTIQSVSLQTAILLQIKEFAQTNRTFSVHDITVELRKKCNTGQLEIPDIEDISGADNFRYPVDHKEVRNLFNQMRDNGVFDSDYTLQATFNKMFYTYTVTKKTSPTPVSKTPSVTPIAIAKNVWSQASCGASSSQIETRVRQYLVNRSSDSFTSYPTIKQIQSAIKRGNRSTGVSTGDLIAMVKALGYPVAPHSRRSKSTVQL